VLNFNTSRFGRLFPDWSVKNITLDMTLYRMSFLYGLENIISNKRPILIDLSLALLRIDNDEGE